MSEISSNSSGKYRILDSIDSRIAKLEEFIMAVGVILMAVNTITNVISRFIKWDKIFKPFEIFVQFILLNETDKKN